MKLQVMRIMAATFALGTAMVLTFSAAAESRERLVVRVPVVRPPPYYWDSNIVPRYRYRPQDDRVDPNGPPVAPVVRLYDGGEIYLPRWWW